MKKVILSFIVMAILLLSACISGAAVTFDYMTLKDQVKVKTNDGYITEPEDVTIDGYVFLGWYNEETFETMFDFEEKITKNQTIYGRFVTETAYATDILPTYYPSNDVYYEIFVRSFADSNGDGIGDLNGITANLDYLSSLGITALWLMPINPSPSYHGYDVTDYYAINPDYGTMEDFENLIEQASLRGIDIIIDLVVNHTSDQHPWYVSAKSSTQSEYRDYYIFPEGSNNAYESFVGGMKDLNYDNPAVNQEMKDIMAFYMNKGVHGFRLDAVIKLFESNTHVDVDYDAAVLIKGWDDYIKTIHPDAYIVSEAWYADYSDYADYYIGSESLFDFDIQTEIMNRLGLGNSIYLFVDNIIDMYDEYRIYRPDFINGLILGNHDMDRIASRSGFNSFYQLEKLKLAASIQMTLPGNPYIYYGEEIAMKGWRDDTNDGFNMPGYGIVYDEVRRAPFIWGSDAYQTDWYPDNQNDTTVDALTQMEQPLSLWTHYQEMIALRKENPALMYGNTLMAYKDGNSKIQGFVRVYEDEHITQAVLVLYSMTQIPQTVNLTGDFEIIYGSLDMPYYGMLIVEIDPNSVGDYI